MRPAIAFPAPRSGRRRPQSDVDPPVKDVDGRALVTNWGWVMETVRQRLKRLEQERDRLRAAYRAAAGRGSLALALGLRSQWLRTQQTIRELERNAGRR